MGEYIHSQQIRFDTSKISCGVAEVHHLPDHTGSQMTFAVANSLYHKSTGRPVAFVVWSDVVDLPQESRGERLANYLSYIKAGVLYITQRTVNPKTGNTIVVWLLTVDHDRFRSWYVDEFANRVEDMV